MRTMVRGSVINDEQGVEVRVEPQRRVEALHRHHRGWPSLLDALPARLTALQGEARAHEDPAQVAEEIRIAGNREAQLEGQAQDELAHGHGREHPVHQPGGGVGHATAAAGGAKTAGCRPSHSTSPPRPSIVRLIRSDASASDCQSAATT
jgi:hypothetical protein